MSASATQGGHKKSLSFPCFSRAIIILFQRLLQKSTSNNNLHISMVIPHQLLLMWLTRGCHPILLKSTVFVHHIHLAAYGLLDTGCTRIAKSVFPEVAQNCLRIPWVFYVLRIPWVFQVFQVCGHPEEARTRIWANAQRDGRPAKYRWRPMFNAAKFPWRPLLECRPVTVPRCETCWN